jgi:hypothetical protein
MVYVRQRNRAVDCNGEVKSVCGVQEGFRTPGELAKVPGWHWVQALSPAAAGSRGLQYGRIGAKEACAFEGARERCSTACFGSMFWKGLVDRAQIKDSK